MVLAETALSQYARRIDPILSEFFQKQKLQTPKSLKTAHQMLKNLEDFCTRGGKRIRPALVYYGYKLFGGDDSKDIIKVSLAMELIHTFFLIHDDIMDQNDLRRGKTTIHKLYEGEYEDLYQGDGNSHRFGEAMGVLAGDLSSCLAFKLLLSTNFSHEQKALVSNKLHETIINTIFGQELDIRLEVSGISKPSEILDVYHLKTAQYTFECPIHIGAMLAGADQQDLKVISDYAIPAGIAFQIRDDILDVFGNQKKIGKLVGSDLKQGKQTLLIARVWEKGTEAQKKRVKAALGNKNLTKKEVAIVCQVMEETGALEFAEKLANKYMIQAKQALKRFSIKGWDKDTIQKLSTITDFIIERKL